jgi:hypothetical protein
LHRKMAPLVKKKKRNKLARVHEALDKRKNPMSKEEMHFIQTCCRIMKASSGDKVKFTDTTVETIGEENPGLMIATIKRLLEALLSKADTCRRDSPTP